MPSWRIPASGLPKRKSDPVGHVNVSGKQWVTSRDKRLQNLSVRAGMQAF